VRRYLQLSPPEWAALSWAHQQSYLEGFYTEGLLERPEPGPAAGAGESTAVPADIAALAVEGAGYRAVETPAFDITGMIADLEKLR
jgi:hypothetical protein